MWTCHPTPHLRTQRRTSAHVPCRKVEYRWSAKGCGCGDGVIGTERGAGPTAFDSFFDGAVGRCFSASGVEGTEAIVEGIIGDPTMVDGSGKDDARKAKLGALEDEGGERVGGLNEDMARVGMGLEEAGGGGCGCGCGCPTPGDDGIDGDGVGIGVVDDDDAKTGFVCTGPVCARGLEVAAKVTGDAEELLANGDGMGGDEGPAGPARPLGPKPNGRLPSAVNPDADADAEADVDVDANVDLAGIAPSDDRLAAMSIGGLTDRCRAPSADPRDMSRGCGLDDGAGEPAREPSREMGRTGRSGNGRTLGGGRCDLDRGLVVMVWLVPRPEGVDVEEEAAVKVEVGVVVRERDGRVGAEAAAEAEAEVEPEGEWDI